MSRKEKYIIWADEHYHSYLALRESDPEKAEAELLYLGDCLKNLMEMTKDR